MNREDLSIPIAFNSPSSPAPPIQNGATFEVPIQWNRLLVVATRLEEEEGCSIPISVNAWTRTRVMSQAKLQVNPNVMRVELKPEQIAARIVATNEGGTTDIDQRVSDYIRLARIRIQSMSEQ